MPSLQTAFVLILSHKHQWMKTTLLTLFMLAGLLAKTQPPSLDFLRTNTADISGDDVANPLFDAAFYRHRYFFFGENHGSARPQQTDYSLFTHLHRKAGVKYYIAEVDFTKAALLNRFLASGDTTLLHKVFRSWQQDTAQWANKEHYQKWMRLQRYQSSLPPSSRISVIGVDVPQDLALVAEQLQALLAGKKTGKFKGHFDSLQRFAQGGNRMELAAFSKRFYPVADSAAPSLKKALGASYIAFHHLLKSFTLLNAGNNRDKVMFLNLMNQLSTYKLEKEKMYGFLGFYHCLQTGYNKSLPMAAMLKQNLPDKNAVVTLAMLALESETMLPFVSQLRQMMPKTYVEKLLKEHPGFPASGGYIPYPLSNDNSMMKVEGMEALRTLSQPSSVRLFRLSGEGSPFRLTKELAEVKGIQTVAMTDAADNTLNAFQYVILFRNSGAATPME